MTLKTFQAAIENINDKYIYEAATYTAKKKENLTVKWLSVAACITIIVISGIIGTFSLFSKVPTNKNPSYFTLTTYAKNGDMVELTESEGYFNSTASHESIFGVDMPLFNFCIRPSDLKENDVLYSRFDISVSYNGSTVGHMDEHLLVAYLIPTVNSDEKQWSYSISGWFVESTDIVITIKDKNLNEIVETITVNVTYLNDRQEYELKIVKWETYPVSNSQE